VHTCWANTNQEMMVEGQYQGTSSDQMGLLHFSQPTVNKGNCCQFDPEKQAQGRFYAGPTPLAGLASLTD